VFPPAIPPAPFLSGGQRGVVEGGGPGNRRAAVHRLGSALLRSRVCLSSVGDEARSCREVVPLCRAFLGVVGEAKASTTPENKTSPPLLCPGGTPLQCQRRDLGDPHWSSWPAHLHLHMASLLLSCFCVDAVLLGVPMVCEWPDLAPSSLGGIDSRRRTQIRELEVLGRGFGRWGITDDFILFS
jgi:hypothetical protein